MKVSLFGAAIDCGLPRLAKPEEVIMVEKSISEQELRSMSPSLSRAYTEAGVNIHTGAALVERIRKLAAATHTHGVLSDIGGFGGLYRPDVSGMKTPVLVASTDGVGTKLKLASRFNRHDTVGIDLVAMSVNDILVQGARPLFFLDYFATGSLDADQAEQVIAGVAEGCRQAGCALLGGETAEMPGMYAPGDYDLAGFCVGLVDHDRIVDGSGISVGDVVIGLASSGLHSNGYTLVRKIFEACGAGPDDLCPGAGRTFREVLLEPTLIYAEVLRAIMRDLPVKGMVHVTGGGFYDNIPRILPHPVCACIDFNSWPKPPVFDWVRTQGGLSWPEMLQIFNCGVGFILMAERAAADEAIARLAPMNMEAWEIGEIRHRGESGQVEICF
jgi:phosphoribosylformylglycinamidine cyclo-ligase